MKKAISFIVLVICLSVAQPLFAADYDKDLSIGPDGVAAEGNVVIGKSSRIYATVFNNSNQDLFGVVKFYDEEKGAFIGEDQPVSVIAQKTDDVFVDWVGDTVGDHSISVRVIPWDEEGDDPANNKVTKVIYVDKDSDGDGIGDWNDNDDDNDGVQDANDSFPLDPSESADTDGDGIGNNADEDDDNDGISDIIDIFPLNAEESEDRDNDGVGDNTDPFPDDPNEYQDSDNDGVGDNTDPYDDNHGPIPQINTAKTMVRRGVVTTFNALDSRDPDGEVVDYKWDLGDGTEATGVVVDHVFTEKGSYDVTLTVSDDMGEQRSQTIGIKVIYKWQTIALIIVTILIILLIIGRGLIFSEKPNPKKAKKTKRMIKIKSSATRRKKALPKKRK